MGARTIGSEEFLTTKILKDFCNQMAHGAEDLFFIQFTYISKKKADGKTIVYILITPHTRDNTERGNLGLTCIHLKVYKHEKTRFSCQLRLQTLL